jgi:acyl-CoA oxidase
VQNLETEAHYDKNTKKFTLISPKSSSSKYWPGLLGIFCTHVVLQAKTFINKKYIGIQTFVLKIRN